MTRKARMMHTKFGLVSEDITDEAYEICAEPQNTTAKWRRTCPECGESFTDDFDDTSAHVISCAKLLARAALAIGEGVPDALTAALRAEGR